MTLVSLAGVEEHEPLRVEQPVAVSPNPTTGRATIRYQLGCPARVTGTVIDASGRTVGVLFDGFQEAGTHSLDWGSADLGPGVYACRIASGGQVWSARLVKTR